MQDSTPDEVSPQFVTQCPDSIEQLPPLRSLRRDSRSTSLRGRILGSLIVLLLPISVSAQGSRSDYDRADALGRLAEGSVFRDRVNAHWYSNGAGFWYRVDLPGGTWEFISVDPSVPSRAPAFDHTQLAEALSKVQKRIITPTRLPIDRLEPGKGGLILFEALGQTWSYDPKSHKIEPSGPLPPAPPAPTRPTRRSPSFFSARTPRTDQSPDGRWVAFVKDHQIHLRERATGQEFPLGQPGTIELGDEPGVYWSPDSSRFVAFRVARAQEHKVSFVQSSPRDQVQPKLLSHDYLKPGDRIEQRWPRLYQVASRAEIPVRNELFSNPWSIQDLHWDANSSRFTFVYNQRGHQSLRVIAVNAGTGEARALVDETTTTFIDYSQKYFFHRINKTSDFLWMSERSGWNHLYRIDGKTGAVRNAVTKGPWVVRAVDRVDDERGELRLQILGYNTKEDPYHVHYARVRYDGSEFTLLTEGDGTHQIAESPDRKYIIDTYSRVDSPPTIELRDNQTGKIVLPLEKADLTAFHKKGLKLPERFVAKGRDGVTDIFGIIHRPLHHDPKRKYPVIEQIYAGPHGAHVPKRFSPIQNAQSMAELGFIVVQIDGMGTNWRSRAFHDVCWKNLADAGFPDRIAWIKAAALRDPSMDLSRVGIYGGSAGGQNALGALLFHPEFYKAAAADCGCHDNRMDKIWWNEAWMGWPIGSHYGEQSNVTNAHKLQGKLLLTVGETDHNVDPASTMQVVNALIRADKDFELIVVPGADHGAGESPYGKRRRRDFFVRSLLGVEPRHQ